MSRKLYLLLLAIFYYCGTASSHTYHAGSCPSVEPMPEFNMRKFLGIWYAVQKTSTASTCLVYNITLGDEPGEFKVEQTSQHFILGLTPLRHTYSYTGQIIVPDPDVPGKMEIKFPLNVAGKSSFTVFMTDYDVYAGIFSCQKLGFVHRRSATLLSREKTLDKIYIEKMRNRLANFLVDPFELSIINQTGCPNNLTEGYNIHIDQDTFSAQNVANVFRKAGEKIGDGVEYAVEAGKKVGAVANALYHDIRDDVNSSGSIGKPPISTDATARTMVLPSGEHDAEWLRF